MVPIIMLPTNPVKSIAIVNHPISLLIAFWSDLGRHARRLGIRQCRKNVLKIPISMETHSFLIRNNLFCGSKMFLMM